MTFPITRPSHITRCDRVDYPLFAVQPETNKQTLGAARALVLTPIDGLHASQDGGEA